MTLPSAWQSQERVEFVRFPQASLREVEVEVGHRMGDVKMSRRSSNFTVVMYPRTRVGWRFRWDVFWNVLPGIVLGQIALRVGSFVAECVLQHGSRVLS